MGVVLGCFAFGLFFFISWRHNVSREYRIVAAQSESLRLRAAELSAEIPGKPVPISFPGLPHSPSETRNQFSIFRKNFHLETPGARREEVCYHNIIPKGHKFTVNYFSSPHSKYAALVQSLLGRDVLSKFGSDIEIASTGQGDLIFRQEAIVSEPHIKLAALEKLLEESSELIQEFRKRPDNSLRLALTTLAKSGHVGALKFLISDYHQHKETQEVFEILTRNRINPRLREANAVIAIQIDQNKAEMVKISKDKEFADDIRKMACRALIGLNETPLIIQILENPPFGAELDLLRAIKNVELTEEQQTFVLAMLDTGDDEIAVEAAMIFRRVGTLNAVMPLKEFGDKRGLSGELKYALELAVQSIQDRCGNDGNRGGLSVTQENSQKGELSLARAQKGRLALTQSKKS